jgi:pSer/pThr/pTyr-binding forkhead associated (FHA) protein
MDVKLVIRKGATRSRTFRILSREALIGRLRGCEVRIPSAEVSRRHCLLRTENGCLTIEDLQSANGTFLNGRRIRGPEVVQPGDRLQVGPVTFVVEYEPEAELVEEIDDVIDAVPIEEESMEALPMEELALEEVPVEEVALEAEVVEDVAVEVEQDLVVPVEFEEQPPLPDFEMGHAEQWYLPAADELRDILGQLDEPPKPKSPGQ